MAQNQKYLLSDPLLRNFANSHFKHRWDAIWTAVVELICLHSLIHCINSRMTDDNVG